MFTKAEDFAAAGGGIVGLGWLGKGEIAGGWRVVMAMRLKN